jgi:PEP-CTERM motif
MLETSEGAFMKSKALWLISGVMVLGAENSALATPIDLTIAGHVTNNTYNYDYTGVFGSIGSLSGDAFNLTLTYDPALAGPDLSPPANSGYYEQFNTSWINISITINGHTESVGTGVSFDQMAVDLGGVNPDSLLVETAYPAAPPGDFNGSYFELQLYSLVGQHFFSNDSVPTYIDPSLIQTGGSRVGDIQIERGVYGNPNVTTGEADAYLGIDSIIGGSLVTPPVTGNVPEPITLSIFGAGLVGAAAMRRRKAKRA